MAKIKKGVGEQKARAAEILERLSKTYSDLKVSLDYTTPLDLLVATILSAQCTDARVNEVTKCLFGKYRTCEDYLRVPVEELEQDVHSCGFYRQKTKSIRETCRSILEEFEGVVPDNMDDLTKLRGVGRKTANVLLASCHGQQAVIVDTHCKRVANRLGFTRNTDPEKIEQDLMKVWPSDRWTGLSHALVLHGRYICVAGRPKCSECPIYDLCPFPDTPEGKKVAR
jgi:endonuclease-3